MNKYIAESLGTCLLVLIGCGSAVLAGSHIGFVGVSFAFGFALLFLAYWLGPISGCHLNPAVTLALAFSKKISSCNVVPYIAAQIIGGIIDGFILLQIAQGNTEFSLVSGFACNGFAEHSPGNYSMISCLITEVVMTTILLLVVIGTTSKEFSVDAIGLCVGATLFTIHLVSIPVTNTSVNLARSIGVAVVHGGWALEQLWLFAAAQLIAVLLAVVLSCLLNLKKC
ncbi:MAG: aquaporin [Proteobacteria bacterium]|nr:aquaporin [Pseudomonadota bacterium]